MKTQTVSDVVEEKNIPLDEILDIFEGYGYGKEEMQDFLDSDMTDLSDAFPELKELLGGKKRKPKSLDAIKDDYNPQSEVRYTSPEELKLSEMSEEDLKQGLEDIKRGGTDYTDAEEPIVTGWIKDEMAKRKSKPKDEEPKGEGDKLDHEIVNDFAIDAIKDNFTPPGAKDEEPDELDAYTKDLEDYLEKNPKAKDKNYY